MEPVTMAILGAAYVFFKGGQGPRMIENWWKELKTEEKKEVKNTIAVIEKDIEKAQIISRIKKSGDGYEIIQNSIGF